MCQSVHWSVIIRFTLTQHLRPGGLRGSLPEQHGETEEETATVKQAKAAIGHQDQAHCSDPDIERPLKIIDFSLSKGIWQPAKGKY